MPLTVCGRPTLSYQRLQTQQILSDQELYDKLRKSVPNKHELQVLESFLIFNKYGLYRSLPSLRGSMIMT